MTEPTQIYFAREGGRESISIDDLEERCIIYVRNVVFGLSTLIDLPKLKNWLKHDVCLKEFPPDEILMRWLTKWTPTYLAQFSYEHDHSNKTRDN